MHRTTRRRVGGLLGSLVIAGGVLLPATASHAAAQPVLDEPITLDTGHVDAFAVVPTDTAGVPRLVLQEDVTGSHVHRTPESTNMLVKSQAFVEGYPASAMPPGAPSDLSLLPLTQDQELVWPGWTNQGLTTAEFGAPTTSIAITAVEGPGTIFMWSQGSFGNVTPVLAPDAGAADYTLPGTISVRANSHVHSNWGFTAPGTYTVTAQATVTPGAGAPGAGTPVQTNTAQYTFTVAPPVESLAISGAEAPVEAGTDIELSVAQAPADSTPLAVTWSTRDSADAEWTQLVGQTEATATVGALDGRQVKASVVTGKTASSGDIAPLVVESEPVTITATGDGEPEEPEVPEQTVAITPLGHHYHQSGSIALTATATPAAADATYAWRVQRPDQDAPDTLEATTASTSLRAEQALDGAEVTVDLIGADDEVLASSDPATIHVDDHGDPAEQQVTIAGVANHYHTGDTAELAASVAPASVLDRWQWFVQHDGETQLTALEGETSSTLSFEVDDEWAGAAVVAALTFDDGEIYVQSNPALIEVDDHDHGTEPPATELSIETNRAADDYWVGQTATLTAKQSAATNLSTYRWLVKQPGADDFTVVEGQSTAVYKFKPTLANSGIQVKSQLLHGTEVHAESAPVTVTAQQREAATTLLVEQDKASYVDGDVAEFTSAQQPQTEHEHYHWYIKRAGAADYVWVDQSRDADLSMPVTVADDGAQLVIRLFDETHATIAESAPVTLEVAPKGGEPEQPVETTLSISGLADHYHTGDTATLTAEQDPATGEDHYHWFIKRAGDSDFSVIAGAFSGTLEHVVAEGDADAQIQAKLYDHDHNVIAESQPVTLVVDDHHGEEPGEGEEPGQGDNGKPADAPTARTGAELDGVNAGGIQLSADDVRPGQVVTIDLDAENAGTWNAVWLFSTPALLGGDWLQANAQGRIAVTIPADVELGEHRLAVFDAEGELVGWQALAVSAADAAGTGAGAGTDGALASTGSNALTIMPIAATLLLLGLALAFAPRLRRRDADTE